MSLLCKEPDTAVDWKMMADEVIGFLKLPLWPSAGDPGTLGPTTLLAGVAHAVAKTCWSTHGDEAAKQLAEKITSLMLEYS